MPSLNSKSEAMATHTPTPVIHVFKEIYEGKYRSVKHYELIEVKNGTTQLSNLINISKDRNCAQSMPDFWLKIKQGKKWSRCLTGLFKTGITNIYKGDTFKKKNLIIFKFSDRGNTLTAYYFLNYYTRNLSNVLQLISKQ
jgi:hypothetical protein